ncbi:MAG: beta-lactamase family protein [Planctomycetes bacterium]|nr:beta-lactamase family protein [Planctomycetota bacterium]
MASAHMRLVQVLFIAGAAAALFLSITDRGFGAGKPPAKDGSVVSGAEGRELEKYLLALDAGAGGFSGSALVVRKGKVLLHKSWGLADAKENKPIPVDALWDWASVTKQFTAAAILHLEMKKKLSIDDSIRKFYPEAPADKAPVTLRHLLQHTSGIRPGFDEGGVHPDLLNRDQTVLAYLNLPFDSKPGEKFAYSNLAYGALAAVIEKVSGQSYEDYCTQLFRAAGMKDACFIGMKELALERVPKDARGTGVPFAYGTRLTWGYRGAGGAVASTSEMYQWDRALRSGKLLSPAALERYYKAGLNDYALGWTVREMRGDTYISHTGAVGATVTAYLRLLKEDVVIALALNYVPATHPEQIAGKLLELSR